MIPNHCTSLKSISFLFYKFVGLKYPVYAYSRNYEANFNSGDHCHDFPQLWYCRSGKYFHRVDDRVFTCAKGSVVIVPPGIYHTFWVEEGCSCEISCLHLSYEAVLSASAELYPNTYANMFMPVFQDELGWELPLYRVISPTSQGVLEDCLSWLSMLAFAVDGMVKKHEIYEKVEQLLSIREFRMPETYHKKLLDLVQTRTLPIFRVISYLNIHYADKITEDTLLEQCGISRAGLYRYFKRIIGHTYSQYLQQLRVRRAYFYVKHTTYSLTYISDICGFFDIHHMSRLFTKYIGESPRARRKSLREQYL